MAWSWDPPSGVFKNHALSSEIRSEAMYDVQTMKFLRPEPGYGKKKGDTLTITRIMQLPPASRVNELDLLPTGRPGINTKSVTVSEWGFTTETTEFEQNLAFFDINNQFQQRLRDQMSLTMEVMSKQALALTPYKYTPEIGGGVFSTNGTAAGVATANLAISDLRQIRDQLRKNKARYYRNGQYVGILSTRAARGIKNDPEFKDWISVMGSGEPMIMGHFRDVEGFMLIETNNVYAYADLVGTSTVCGEALFFGADPGFLAIVDNPEVRAGIPQNLGRYREVGWVGTLEASLTWDIASIANVIQVTST